MLITPISVNAGVNVPTGDYITVGTTQWSSTVDDGISPNALSSVDHPADGECFTYNLGASQGEWGTCGAADTNAGTICAGDTTYLSGEGNCNDLDNQYVELTDSVDAVADVDTVSDAPVKDEVLKWNGTNWVPATYNTSFVFSIGSFADGEGTSQLIGSGTWKNDSAMSYIATYNNGPPTTAYVDMSNNGAAYAREGVMTAPTYLTGTNSDGAVAYPAAKSQYLRFRLYAAYNTETDTEYETAIYFYNYNFYGVNVKDSGYTEANIEGETGYYDTDSSYSVALNAGAGEYLVYAYPTSYTELDEGDDYEDDGGTDFTFNGVAVAMIQDSETLSITNSAGYAENYDVYVSKLANLGNHTFVANSTDQTINYVWYGKTTDASGYNEADVEGCANSEATNDPTQVWDSITIGVGEYLLFCFPKRLGEKDDEYTFYDYGTGLGFDFQAAETVGVTNVNGWAEDYFVYRSTNANLGACVVETK